MRPWPPPLRLHVFLPGYFDRPHNHRWTYSSRILHGSYTHTLYGTDDQLGTATESPAEPARKRMDVAHACLRQLTQLRVLN